MSKAQRRPRPLRELPHRVRLNVKLFSIAGERRLSIHNDNKGVLNHWPEREVERHAFGFWKGRRELIGERSRDHISDRHFRRGMRFLGCFIGFSHGLKISLKN